MSYFDIIVNCYGNLRNPVWLPVYFFTPLRRIIRFLAEFVLPRYLASNKTYVPKKNVNVIVSFTSFPARINGVWQVVECMMRQTYKPKKIILWLSKEQFPNDDSIPQSLLNRIGDIFEIRMVSDDIRSHKKYYYVSQEYPNSLVLLIDDDIYYPSNMIEQLFHMRKVSNGSVVCRYGYIIKYNNGIIAPYSSWDRVNTNSNSSDLFFGSGGGTLFKPSQLYSDLTNLDLSIKLTPTADDIWLNAMLRLAGTPLVMVRPKSLLPVKTEGTKQTLCSINVSSGCNDKQIANVREYYMKTLGIDPFFKQPETC